MYRVNQIEQKKLVLMSYSILKLVSKQPRKCQLYHPFCQKMTIFLIFSNAIKDINQIEQKMLVLLSYSILTMGGKQPRKCMSPTGLCLLHQFPLDMSIRFCASTISQQVALKDGWIRIRIGMTGGMAKYWIIPRVGGQGAASCRLFNWALAVSPFLMFLSRNEVLGASRCFLPATAWAIRTSNAANTQLEQPPALPPRTRYSLKKEDRLHIHSIFYVYSKTTYSSRFQGLAWSGFQSNI